MGAEIGATTSIFPYDERSADYLAATGRKARGRWPPTRGRGRPAGRRRGRPPTPSAYFDRVIEIDLSTLEPHVVGPHTPDLAREVSALGAEAKAAGWPLHLSQALVGSCTNSSYEDISRAASVARQAAAAGLRTRTPLLITPGSETVRATVERDGLLADLEAIGASVLANACGPCIGQWARSDVVDGEANSIISSFNRNFPKRNDGNAVDPGLHRLPRDHRRLRPGRHPRLQPPGRRARRRPPGRARRRRAAGQRLRRRRRGLRRPAGGRQRHRRGHRPGQLPAPAARALPAVGRPGLRPRCRILLKAVGKCTTDHISAAGRWLQLPGPPGEHQPQPVPGGDQRLHRRARHRAVRRSTARPSPSPTWPSHYRDAGVAVGGGGRRELRRGVVPGARGHGAPLPRGPGGHGALVRPHPRDQPQEAGRAAPGLRRPRHLRPDRRRRPHLGPRPGRPRPRACPVACRLHRPDGSTVDFECTHSLSAEHIEWFRAGSALNLIRQRFR